MIATCTGRAMAQPPVPGNPPQAAETIEKGGLRTAIGLLKASGTVGIAILLLSVWALALIADNAMNVRRRALLPRGLAEDLHARISSGDLTEAERICRQQPSYLSYVILAGLNESRYGYAAVEKGMEDASADQAARLLRRTEYLALIGNIAPMLGLLGTVYGLVLAFKQVAESQGAASAADLADGIYLALITTVEGLVVAIPTLSAYAIFRSWIEGLASEVNLTAESIFAPYKRSRHLRG